MWPHQCLPGGTRVFTHADSDIYANPPDAFAYACTYTHADVYTYPDAFTDTCTYTHAYTNHHIYANTNALADTYSYTCANAYGNPYAYTYFYTHANTNAYTDTHANVGGKHILHTCWLRFGNEGGGNEPAACTESTSGTGIKKRRCASHRLLVLHQFSG